MKKKSIWYYIITAALLIAGCHLCYMNLGAILDSVIMTLTNGAFPIGPCMILAAAVFALIYRYSKKNRNIFKGYFNFRNTKKAFILIIPIFVYAVISNWKNFAAPYITLPVIFSALYAGICEDITWRALPISHIMKFEDRDESTLMYAMILPAVGFGLIHLGNISAGSSVVFVMLQVLQTFAVGLLFGAVYLRTGDMTMLFIAHVLNDLFNFMVQTDNEIGVYTEVVFNAALAFDIAFSVFAIVYAFYLVRKEKRADIIAVWNSKWSKG